jgi:ribulose-phosphate 3-epimerase
MVKAIRKSCDECSGPKAILDLHMCTHTPARFVGPMAAAGANRFIFQWEACASLEEAIDLVLEITSAGLACGVSINPGTNVDEIFPLLETNMIDVVTVLAVHPGFGGQRLQKVALETIAKVRQWRRMSGVDFEILVDGGINHETAGQVVLAGADVLVSGSFVFHHPGGISLAVLDLITESKPFR